MANQQYNGLCVGGPLDGKSMSHYAPTRNVPEREEPPSFRYGSVPINTVIRHTTYIHHVALKFGPYQICLWLPDGVKVEDGITKVFEAYQKR